MMTLTYHQAMADVHARVKAAKTSFAAGMSVLPAPRREAMYALYAFCREVDDIADDSPTPEIREKGLSAWREKISGLFRDRRADHSITVALLPAIEHFGLVEQDFQDIIEGMEMDASAPIVAPSLAELDRYCDRVASAVGRSSVRIFGDPSDEAMRVAHHLGRALQLTNILRDLAEDSRRGRLYLPKEFLEQNGIVRPDPAEILKHPALPSVCRALANVARDHFDEAGRAMKASLWHPMRPARAMKNYYKAIFDKLIKEDWKNPEKRVSLSFGEKLLVFLRGWAE